MRSRPVFGDAQKEQGGHQCRPKSDCKKNKAGINAGLVLSTLSVASFGLGMIFPENRFALFRIRPSSEDRRQRRGAVDDNLAAAPKSRSRCSLQLSNKRLIKASALAWKCVENFHQPRIMVAATRPWQDGRRGIFRVMKRIATIAFYAIGTLAILYLALYAYAMVRQKSVTPGEPIHIFRNPEAPDYS